jgi:hypothetical protein
MSAEITRNSWFEHLPRESIRVHVARPGLTAVVGGLVGAAASVPSLALAQLASAHMSSARPFDGHTPMIVAGIAGTLLGALLCLVMMHASRWFARVMFASVMTPAVIFCVHIGLLTHDRPTLPVAPLLIAAGVFGACIACVPPLGRRRLQV